MYKRQYKQLLTQQPQNIPHIERVIRQDKEICRYYQSQINLRTLNSEGTVCIFFQLMDTLLLEYLFSQPALADRLLEEEIESPTKSKKILPVSLQISIAHMSPWLWPEDLSKQIEMMVYYINHIRPIVRHIFCELQGLKSNESAPF